MVEFGFLDTELLERAYFSPLRPDEICWKLHDIQTAIEAFSSSGNTIGAISIYFKSGDGVYCPMWGDCLMLPGGNTAYLQLFAGMNLEQEVTLDFIYGLIARFTLVMPNDYDRTADEARYKESVTTELAHYNLTELYFCLQLD